MDELQKLLAAAEELRARLRRAVEAKSFQDPEVLALSRRLDALLVEYLKLLKERP